MSIKTGVHDIELVEDTVVRIEAETEFTVFLLGGEPLEPVKILARSLNRRTRLDVHEPAWIRVQVPDGVHFSIDEKDIPKPTEELDPTPVEIPDDVINESPLIETLQRFITEAVAERYGKESDEYETYEESVDFGPDEEELLEAGLVSGHEIPEGPFGPPGNEVNLGGPTGQSQEEELKALQTRIEELEKLQSQSGQDQSIQDKPTEDPPSQA